MALPQQEALALASGSGHVDKQIRKEAGSMFLGHKIEYPSPGSGHQGK